MATNDETNKHELNDEVLLEELNEVFARFWF